MSLLSQASLVVVPSGYKEDVVYSVKPTDGSGDLTFTRASDGTRVNSQGLVERVPWNLVTYSEQFDNADWSKENATITANSVTSPSGLQDADTLTDNTTSGRHRLQSQTISFISGTAYTYSVFVKKNSSGRFLLINAASGANARAALNLDTLEITNINGTGKVEDYGNGWYRFSVTGTATATANQATYIQMQNSASDVNYVGDGSSFYIWGAQLNEGSTAKPYFPTTDRLNVPRLDYSNGCPSLLLEPQRTNVFTYSESFDNAAWTKQDATITANAAISPDGTQNADLYTTSSDLYDFVRQSILFTSGTSYTMSVFAKAGTSDELNLGYSNLAFSSGPSVTFDLGAKSYTILSGSPSVTLEEYGNGWFRCSITDTATLTITRTTGFSIPTATAISNIYLWGAQLEAGAYPTSYIPTTSASVTRVADTATADVTSILTSNAGTLFIHLDNKANSGGYSSGALSIGLQDATSANLLGWASNSPSSLDLRGIYRVGGVTTFLGASTTINTESKILIKWGGGFVKFFKNGALFDSQVVTDFTGQPLEDYLLPNAARTGNFPINQTVIFPTALTDAECISLTTL